MQRQRRMYGGSSAIPYSPSVWTEPGKFPSAVGGGGYFDQSSYLNINAQRQLYKKLNQRRTRTRRRRGRRQKQRRRQSRRSRQ